MSDIMQPVSSGSHAEETKSYSDMHTSSGDIRSQGTSKITTVKEESLKVGASGSSTADETVV